MTCGTVSWSTMCTPRISPNKRLSPTLPLCWFAGIVVECDTCNQVSSPILTSFKRQMTSHRSEPSGRFKSRPSIHMFVTKMLLHLGSPPYQCFHAFALRRPPIFLAVFFGRCCDGKRGSFFSLWIFARNFFSQPRQALLPVKRKCLSSDG